jgi:hypothetical protein
MYQSAVPPATEQFCCERGLNVHGRSGKERWYFGRFLIAGLYPQDIYISSKDLVLLTPFLPPETATRANVTREREHTGPLREIPVSQTDIIRLAGDQRGVALALFAWREGCRVGCIPTPFPLGHGRGSTSVFDVLVQRSREISHATAPVSHCHIQLPVWASKTELACRHGGTESSSPCPERPE